VPAEADLRGLISRAPARSDPALQIGPAASLGTIGLGDKVGLRLAAGGRQDRGLRAEADAVVRSQIAAHADLRNPEPEIAGPGELGEADGGQGRRAHHRDRRRLLAHQQRCPGPGQLGERAAEAEQGKGAAPAAGLLAAEEVHVQLTVERAAPELRHQADQREAGLPDGGGGGARRGIVAGSLGHGELRHVAVVDLLGGVEAVHQDEAVQAGLDVGTLPLGRGRGGPEQQQPRPSR
jgi:hypothetical protein